MTSSNRPSDDAAAKVRARRAAKAAQRAADAARVTQGPSEAETLSTEIKEIDHAMALKYDELLDTLNEIMEQAEQEEDKYDQAVEPLEAQRSEKQARLDELTSTDVDPDPEPEPARVPAKQPATRPTTPKARVEPSDTPTRVRRAPRKSRRKQVLDKMSGVMDTFLTIKVKTFLIIGAIIGLWVFFAFNHDDSLGDGVAYRVLPLYIVFYALIVLGFGLAIKYVIRTERKKQDDDKKSDDTSQD